MNLRLEIIKAPSDSDLLETVIDVDMNGLSIGRAENNDLVLKDDSSISKQHAVIQYQHGDFYIYDISTNGVYVSSNLQALNTQENNFQLLKNNDSLRIGSYILRISLGDEDNEISHELDLESLIVKKSKGPALLAEEENPENQEESFVYGAQVNETKVLKDSPDEFDLDSFLRGESSSQGKSEEIIKSEAQNSLDLLEGLESETQNTLDVLEDLESKSQDMLDLTIQAQASQDVVVELNEAQTVTTEESLDPPNNFSQPAALESPLINLLFEQLGMADYKMDSVKQETVLKQLVTLVRTTLQCMHDSIRKRQDSLPSLGLTPIVYKKTANNPILFSANVDEILSKLLFPPKGEVYLGIEESIPQCFSDLEHYQYYLTKAAKDTLEKTLEQFSPKAVGEVLCDVEVKKGLFSNRKSLINFNQYIAHYEKINAQSAAQLNRMLQQDAQALPGPAESETK